MTPSRQTRSARLLQVLADYRQVWVVMHDTPDPDAIASGWALVWLVREKLGKPTRLIGGGDIVRAENRHMLRLLEPPVELVRKVDCQEGTAVVLVDCHPGSQNHLFAGQCVMPVAVVDHHSGNGCPIPKLRFSDIRPRVAASATIAASYLREQKLEPSRQLATALVYAIRTETQGSETHYSRLDRAVLAWLTERSEPSQLAEIESAPLSVEYFADLVLAFQQTVLYGETAFCLLPRAHGTEIVGEVADLLIRGEPIHRVLCGAVVEGDLVLSVRTEPGWGDATRLVQTTLADLGQGGGHRYRAGGRITGIDQAPRIAQALRDELRQRWLAACGVSLLDGRYLIARHEIVANL